MRYFIYVDKLKKRFLPDGGSFSPSLRGAALQYTKYTCACTACLAKKLLAIGLKILFLVCP